MSAPDDRFETASTEALAELGLTRAVEAAQSTTAEMSENEIHSPSVESLPIERRQRKDD